MRYRKLSADGDYVFGQNKQDFYQGIDSITQAIKTNLLLLQGEWWEDTKDGLPLFQSIVSQKNTTIGVDLLIKERISSTKGVQSVVDFKSSFDGVNRTYSYTATANTTDGITTVGSVL